MSKGVLIMALGHENYYHMAAVLAASIKVNDPGLPVCLLTTRAINPAHADLFDVIKTMPEKAITRNGKLEYIKGKLFMYDLSPFKETIFLDADQVLIAGKKLSTLFTELADVDLTFSNTGLAEVSIWADIAEVKKLYGSKPYWNYHSELVYFKKTAKVKAYFDAAKKVYQDDKIKSAERFSAATMADELAFQVAAMVTGMYPHRENWTPNFWYDRNGNLSRKYTYELDFTTYSIGGNSVPTAVKNNYNILAKHYFAKLGLLNPYRVIDKRYFLPERNKI